MGDLTVDAEFNLISAIQARRTEEARRISEVERYRAKVLVDAAGALELREGIGGDNIQGRGATERIADLLLVGRLQSAIDRPSDWLVELALAHVWVDSRERREVVRRQSEFRRRAADIAQGIRVRQPRIKPVASEVTDPRTSPNRAVNRRRSVSGASEGCGRRRDRIQSCGRVQEPRVSDVVDVNRLLEVQSNVSNVVGRKHTTMNDFTLETDVHLVGTGGSEIGIEPGARHIGVKSQIVADKTRVGSRSGGSGSSLVFCLQSVDQGTCNAKRLQTDAGG